MISENPGYSFHLMLADLNSVDYLCQDQYHVVEGLILRVPMIEAVNQMIQSSVSVAPELFASYASKSIHT